MRDEINYEMPQEQFLRSIDVHQLLPQQEPFVMIGNIVGFSMKSTITETTVKDDNIFVENGVLTEPGIVENIAQTCAARLGYLNKYILKNDYIQIGFIGAIKNLEIIELPQVGNTITTTVDILEEVMGMVLAEAVVCSGGKSIASTQMKIAVQNQNKSS